MHRLDICFYHMESYNTHMQNVATRVYIFVLVCAFLCIGWLAAHHKQKAVYKSTIRQALSRFNGIVSRIIGLFIAIFCALFAIHYLILIPLDLLGIKLGF